MNLGEKREVVDNRFLSIGNILSISTGFVQVLLGCIKAYQSKERLDFMTPWFEWFPRHVSFPGLSERGDPPGLLKVGIYVRNQWSSVVHLI